MTEVAICVGHAIRTIPVPEWAKEAIDSWTLRAGINAGPLLRSINKAGRIWGHGFTPRVIWGIVKASAKSCGLPTVAPHDLRRPVRGCAIRQEASWNKFSSC